MFLLTTLLQCLQEGASWSGYTFLSCADWCLPKTPTVSVIVKLLRAMRFSLKRHFPARNQTWSSKIRNCISIFTYMNTWRVKAFISASNYTQLDLGWEKQGKTRAVERLKLSPGTNLELNFLNCNPREWGSWWPRSVWRRHDPNRWTAHGGRDGTRCR